MASSEQITVRPPEAKPNPADPLSNPPTFAEVTPRDKVPLPNEPPPEEPKDAPRPGCPPTQPDHPLGPRRCYRVMLERYEGQNPGQNTGRRGTGVR